MEGDERTWKRQRTVDGQKRGLPHGSSELRQMPIPKPPIPPLEHPYIHSIPQMHPHGPVRPQLWRPVGHHAWPQQDLALPPFSRPPPPPLPYNQKTSIGMNLMN
jgi:hypothetical protein